MRVGSWSSMKTIKPFAMMIIVALGAVLTGCADFTAGPAPLNRTIDPKLVEEHPRVGYVYCARGWLGIFSTGMMDLANELNTKVGVSAVSVADMEYLRLEDWLIQQHEKGTMNEPLVLLGHSWGADDMIRVAEDLQKHDISVDLMVLIDPVTPPPVPSNVKRVYCVYKSHPLTDWYPAWRGVPATVVDPQATPLTNIDLRTAKGLGFDTESISHPDIEKSEGVHNLAIEQIKMVCPLRTVWMQNHPAGARAVQSGEGAKFNPTGVRSGAGPVGAAPPVPEPAVTR